MRRIAPLVLACILATAIGAEEVYDVSRFREVDPELIVAEESEPIEAGLIEITAVAVVPDGGTYLAGSRGFAPVAPGEVYDGGIEIRPGLLVLGAKKAPDRWVALGAASRALAVAKDGTVYLGMKDHLEVLTKGAKKTTAWSDLGEKAVITSIAVRGGDVIVADAGSRVVWRFDRTGALVNMIGRKDEKRGIEGFVVPSAHFDVAFSPDGDLWVTNPGRQRLEQYTLEGDLVKKWGRASMKIDGFPGCCNPTDFAFLPDGSFVTSEKGIPRVKLYDSRGKFVGVIAPPQAFDEKTAGIDLAVDGEGRILALDPKRGKLRVFEMKERENG